MATINPHINFNGNAEEAFNFYKSVFGGELTDIIRFKDLPANPHMQLAPGEENNLMNIALPIGPTKLIGNDVPSFMGRTNERENRSKISISASTQEEASRLFDGLSAGGEVEVLIENSSFGMFRDKYGIEWIVKFDAK